MCCFHQGSVIASQTFVLVKMSSRRLDQDEYIRLGHTSSSCIQDVFKTSSRRTTEEDVTGLVDTSLRHLQDVFKTSLKRITQGKLVLLTHLQQVLIKYYKDKYPQKDSLWPRFLSNL